MSPWVVLALLLGAAQEPPRPAPVPEKAPSVVAREEGVRERLITAERAELRGELDGYEAAGYLVFKEKGSGRTLRIAAEEVVRINFGSDDPVKVDAQAERLRLLQGGVLSGRLASYENGLATFAGPAGRFRVRRQDLRGFVLGSLSAAWPEIRPEVKADILVREAERVEDGKPVKEAVAEYGELLSVGESVVFRRMAEPAVDDKPARPEETVTFERSAVKQAWLHVSPASSEVPPGWFARVLFRNGDKCVGVLRGVSAERVRLFSHAFGTFEVEKVALHSITFVPHARMSAGFIVITDQAGVRIVDRLGKEHWKYTNNVEGCWNARKLENENILVCNSNYNQVIEVRPGGAAGGEVVWTLPNLGMPYDAVRLDNGNTLVAEASQNRVAEYDANKQLAWKCETVHYPISVQRLENGNTLICSNYQLVEVDRAGQNRWTFSSRGARRVRPWRAERLENGNTLVTDYQGGQVVEVDPQGGEVWRMEGVERPMQAIRLEDGNTLILEQQRNRVIEVDPSKRIVQTIEGLNTPQGMSVY